MATPYLVSLPRVKDFLGLPQDDTSQDVQLTALKSAAEAVVREYVGRNLTQASYTEFYPGNGQRALVLRHRPVTAVASIHLDNTGYFGRNPDGAFDPTASLLADGRDYVLDWDVDAGHSRTGIVWRLGTSWAEVPRQYYPRYVTQETGIAVGNIKVTYTAGFAPGAVPQDLQYAVCFLASYMKRTVEAGAHLHAERLGDYSYELVPPRWDRQIPELGTTASLLRRYKECAF